jgi:hypothetical protein
MRGAAHHQPKTALRTRRSNVVSDSQKQAMGTSGAKLRPIQEWHDHQGNRSQGMPTSLSCASAPKPSRRRAASMTIRVHHRIHPESDERDRRCNRAGADRDNAPPRRSSRPSLSRRTQNGGSSISERVPMPPEISKRLREELEPTGRASTGSMAPTADHRDDPPDRLPDRLRLPYSPVPGFEEVSNEASSRGR